LAKRLWAGLDVGVDTTSVCIIDEQGEVIREAVCPTNVKSLHRELVVLKRRKWATVALESGGGTSVARGLQALGYKVILYETRQLSGFLKVRRIKTDAGDANGIAQAGRIAARLISNVHLKSFESQSLGARLRIRRHIIKSRTKAVNLLCRQLEHFGGRIRRSTRSPELRVRVESELRALFGRAPTPLSKEMKRLLDHCLHLMAQEKEIDRELMRLARSTEVCRRFMEIPGVGPVCALSFYAAVDEPTRFKRSCDVGSYLGLTPKLYQSGLTTRSGRISKMGNKEARSMLVTASLRFMACSSTDVEIHAWTKALELRRGRLKSRVALARKLATVMLAMWKSGEPYRPRLISSPKPDMQSACAREPDLDGGSAPPRRSAAGEYDRSPEAGPRALQRRTWTLERPDRSASEARRERPGPPPRSGTNISTPRNISD
jgi:transposase